MTNEFKHTEVGIGLSEIEYDSIAAHSADGQTTGDILYFDGTSWIRKPYSEVLQLLLTSGDQMLITQADGTVTAITVTASGIVGKGAAGDITSLTPAQVMTILSGGATAAFSMNTQRITTLAAPTTNGDAVRATTKITEALLESATDLKHTQNTDTDLDSTFEATFVKKADYDANSILIAVTDNVPAPALISGTTAQKPVTGVDGQTYLDTDLTAFYVWKT